MAAENTITKIAVTLKLDNGQTETGTQRTISASFPTLSLTGYDDDKALALAQLVAPCLDRTLVRIQKQITSELADGE